MTDKNIPVPEGNSVVSPYLIVESIEKQADFIKKVFGSSLSESAKQPDGQIMHAEVNIGNTTIMLGKSNERFPPAPGMMYVYVKNADDVYKKALNNGAVSLMPPEDRFYGNREGGVKDPQGNTWWIAQFQRKVSPEEIEKGMAEMMKQK